MRGGGFNIHPSISHAFNFKELVLASAVHPVPTPGRNGHLTSLLGLDTWYTTLICTIYRNQLHLIHSACSILNLVLHLTIINLLLERQKCRSRHSQQQLRSSSKYVDAPHLRDPKARSILPVEAILLGRGGARTHRDVWDQPRPACYSTAATTGITRTVSATTSHAPPVPLQLGIGVLGFGV